MSCVSHAFVSVHCYLVVTHWERADLLALVGDVYCICVTFPCGILSHVWYLIVSFPDFCHPSYFHNYPSHARNDHIIVFLLPLIAHGHRQTRNKSFKRDYSIGKLPQKTSSKLSSNITYL